MNATRTQIPRIDQKWKWFNINGGNYLVIFMCWYFKCSLATEMSCRWCYVYAEIHTLCESMMARRPPYISLMFIAYHSASSHSISCRFRCCLFYLFVYVCVYMFESATRHWTESAHRANQSWSATSTTASTIAPLTLPLHRTQEERKIIK